MLCQKNEYQKRKKLQKQKKKTLLIEKTNNIFKGFLNPIHKKNSETKKDTSD